MGYILGKANDSDGLIFMGIAFCITSIIVTVLRFYARKVNNQGFKADDWIALAALPCLLALNVVWIYGSAELVDGHHVVSGHSPVVGGHPVPTTWEHEAERIKYIFRIIEKPYFALVKISILYLWLRIFGHVRWFKITAYTMIVVVALWGVAFFFETIFECGTDWYLATQAPVLEMLSLCTNTQIEMGVFAASDIFSDLIIILMPIPLIWSLQMAKKKRTAILALFCIGFFTIGAGIARLFYYMVADYDKEDNPDFIADFTLFFLWSVIEANVAIFCCCMPCLLPIFAKVQKTSFWSSTRRLLTLSNLSGGVGGSSSNRRSRGRNTKGSEQLDDSYSERSLKGLVPSTRNMSNNTDTATTVSAMSHDDDLEKQTPPSRGTVVQSHFVRHQDNYE